MVPLYVFYLPRQQDAVRLDVPVDDVAVVAVLQGLLVFKSIDLVGNPR